MMGSVFHLGQHVKIQARFVEIKTGIVLFTVESENRENDFNKAAVDLVKNIAENLNRKLSNEALAKLSAASMSRENFKKYTRQELAKDSMQAKKIEKGSKVLPRWPFWVSVTTFTLSLATMTSQLIILEQNDPHGDEKKIRSVFAVLGLGLTVFSAGYMIFDSAWQNKIIKEEKRKTIQVTPQINAGKGGGGGITVSGSF
jgi:hypothetical protein